MGNPQPRGLRQAPLVPSGFFQLDLANQLSGGDVGGVPPGKSGSLSGNSEPGGFHDHTHNEGLWIAHGELTRYSRTGGFLDHSRKESLPGTLEPEGFSSTPTTTLRVIKLRNP